jgi:hypothetical protein
MPINEGQVLSIFQQVRLFYKGFEKSDNKKYNLNEIAEPSAKHQLRNHNQPLQTPRIGESRQIARRDKNDWYTMGLYLWVDQKRFGNCTEMSAVTAFLCSERLGNNAKILMGHVVTPGDHVFVLISADGTVPPGDNISLLAQNNDSDKFWIIDVWSNIACKPRYYPSRLLEKFHSWSNQKKMVWGRNLYNEANWYDPNSRSFITAFLGSRLVWDTAKRQV